MEEFRDVNDGQQKYGMRFDQARTSDKGCCHVGRAEGETGDRTSDYQASRADGFLLEACNGTEAPFDYWFTLIDVRNDRCGRAQFRTLARGGWSVAARPTFDTACC
jgi:hypothetical protein